MSQNILLASDVVIKERTGIHGNIDAKLMRDDIKYAQDVYIAPILGTALYDKLQTIVSDNTINTNAALVNYKNLIERYLIDTLKNFFLYEFSLTGSYQFWNKGIVKKQGENTTLPDMSEIYDVANKYKTRAEHYGQRMRLYIIQNAPAMFPEYLRPGSTIDTVVPDQRQFTMPVYLGEGNRRDNPFCNPGGFDGQPYHD